MDLTKDKIRQAEKTYIEAKKMLKYGVVIASNISVPLTTQYGYRLH